MAEKIIRQAGGAYGRNTVRNTQNTRNTANVKNTGSGTPTGNQVSKKNTATNNKNVKNISGKRKKEKENLRRF